MFMICQQLMLFRTKKQIPMQFASEQRDVKKRKIGHPQDEEKNDAFLKVARFLQENDDEQITVVDLVEKMEEYLADSASTAYGRTHMKARLQEHFGDQIIITEINGKPNVVTFRSTVANILHDFHAQPKNVHLETEKLNIIRTASRLIKSDIKLIKTSNDIYPLIETEADTNANFLPQTLKLLVEGILASKDDVKVASIGQAIIQAARPQVILAPLQVGLAVQLHHHFASRFLIDTLHRLGFCSSYQVAQLFNQNAALDQGTDIPDYNGEFVQYVADNVDHNVRTLDGNDTFHGMGMIATVTPGTKPTSCVPIRKVSPQNISASGKVEIHPPSEARLAQAEIKYDDVVVVKALDPTANWDVLWKTSLLFDTMRPAWAGMMQVIHQGNHKGKSSITFLPMIDMNPSDVTCVSSTLKFVSEHAQRHNIANPIVTFDQPLWWKAFNIIQTEPADSDLRKVILRLGAFHTEMSFLGTIGHLMAGSGLRELLELIYASNAVDHILTEKAIARAVRAHLIVDVALNALLYSAALGVPIPQLQHDLASYLQVIDAADVGAKHPEQLQSGNQNKILQEAHALFKGLIDGKENVC
ncbi:unnamed protein product [Porites lobata]|uniref:Vitellogenin n=1 Tax=Porites lobata TaxID=104759 RepID=A0ABN8QAD7_9CNID|nr:unnamed protein product [Porites lobata]